MSPIELALNITPRARLDVVDVRARTTEVHGEALRGFRRHFYASEHSTAGFLSQSLAARLHARFGGIGPYLDVFRTVFPEGAGYRHDQLELRDELAPEQKAIEPTNADSHLAFMGGGLRACVTDDAQREAPVYFVDFDGVYRNVPRKRTARVVGFNTAEEVARVTIDVPVSGHAIDAVNLRESRIGLFDQVSELIQAHGVTKGRVRLELATSEQFASLTVNEYETLLMKHDLAEVLQNPLRFAAEKVRHAWKDPRAVPAKALGYAQYDMVRALNQLLDALGLKTSRIERLVARSLEAPASRFLRMRRSVDLMVS
ncbi:MAG: YjbQ family protein, partial [Acidobacteria bacterium]|nr:YjbQ family protein [Acidobacteriota bacterium]